MSDHSRFFDPRDSVESQLRDGSAWLVDRTGAPEFGFSFAPQSLPFPHRYAPLSIAGRFETGAQRWRPVRGMERAWLEPAGGPTMTIAFRGRIPRGDNHFPLPLYGRVVEGEGEGVRLVRGREGRMLLVAARPADVTGELQLDLSPDFAGVDPERAAGAPRAVLAALLEPTVPDEELPDETLAFVEELRVADGAPLDKAVAVRGFIQRRYRYDPSYLEDAAVAQWLRRATAGRPNVHLAALHAGQDSRHLGSGVCYELGVLGCELLRRAGIPAAVASGWTWDAGELADPDHMWAMALLPTESGPRWLPIDPSTTRDGRPLRVGRRPAGGWDVEAPKQPRQRPRDVPEGLERDEPRQWEGRRSRSGGEPGAATPSPRGMRQRKQTKDPRRKRSQRPPIGELMRVVRHLSELSGQPLEHEGLVRRCREALEDPEAAARLLDALDMDIQNDM